MDALLNADVLVAQLKANAQMQFVPGTGAYITYVHLLAKSVWRSRQHSAINTE